MAITTLDLETPEGVLEYLLDLDADKITIVFIDTRPRYFNGTGYYKIEIYSDDPDSRRREVFSIDYLVHPDKNGLRPITDCSHHCKLVALNNFVVGETGSDYTTKTTNWSLEPYAAKSIFDALQRLVAKDGFINGAPGFSVRLS